MFRVTQLPDLHFTTDALAGPRDVDETWDAVCDHAFAQGSPPPDLIAITGDIAHHVFEHNVER